MSKLQLYRGAVLEMRYIRRQGSAYSAQFLINGQLAAHAQPCDFIALRSWLLAEQQALSAFMAESEDTKVAENLRGDTPEGS